MHACNPCRFQNGVWSSRQIKSRNIDCDTALEQFDILWQIADISTQCFRGPLIQRCVVEFDLATKPRPDTNKRTGQR